MVKLSLRILGSSKTLTQKAFVDSLHNLPDVPTDLYQKLWARIQEQDDVLAHLAKRIFAWVTYSRRNLSSAELQHGLYFHDVTDTTTLPDDISEYMVDPEDIERVCLGVICLKKETGVMGFQHHTAEIFFPEYFDTDFSGQAHEWIATACLNHIMSSALNPSTPAGERPLHNYAALCWGDHVRDSPHQSMDSKVIDLLLDNTFAHQAVVSFASALRWWPDKLSYTCESPQPSCCMHPLHLAAYFGLNSIIDNLVSEQHISVDTRMHANSWTPIRWALYNVQEDTVLLLIWKGADLELQYEDGNTILMAVLQQALPWPPNNNRGPQLYSDCRSIENSSAHFGNCYRLSPTTQNLDGFHRYPERFPVCLYHILYNSNCLDMSNDSGLTALCIATLSKRVGHARDLANLGARIDTRFENGLTPLLCALQPSHDTLYSGMILTGSGRCHLGMHTEFDRLERESKYGPKELIDDASGERILWVTEEAVLSLISKDVDLDAKDAWDRTALSYAAEYGFQRAVKELLRLNADTETTDHCKRTPLIWSLRRSAKYRCLLEDIHISGSVKVLIGHSFDFDALLPPDHDMRDQTMLFLSRSPMVIALAEKTRDVSHRDNSGKSAFDLAIDEGLPALAEFLKQRVQATGGSKGVNEAASPVFNRCVHGNGRTQICQHAPGAISVDNLYVSENGRVSICASQLEHVEHTTIKLDRRRPMIELRVRSVHVSDNAKLAIAGLYVSAALVSHVNNQYVGWLTLIR
jgi:ankyrin repeat protein